MQRKIKLTWWFVYEWGKPPRQEPHQVILKSPLPRISYYHNKWLQVKESQYLIPTYNWTLTQIPNWTCFVVIISHFQCTAPSTWLANQCTNLSTWLTTNLRRMLASKFSIHQHNEDHETPWLQNPTASNTTASWRERWTRAYVLGHCMLLKNFCIELH